MTTGTVVNKLEIRIYNIHLARCGGWNSEIVPGTLYCTVLSRSDTSTSTSSSSTL
jgi:hypothetical protein